MFLKYNQFSIATFLIILMLCLLPGSQVPDHQQGVLDKVLHAFIFGLLCYTLIIGLLKQHQFPRLMYNAFWSSIVFCLLYALFTEAFQKFILTDRTFDVLDLLADAIGVVIGAIAFLLVKGKEQLV